MKTSVSMISRPHQLIAILILLAAALGGGCATTETARLSGPVFTGNSPLPELATNGDAWKMAEASAATIPGGDVVVGSGDSMAPLYKDRTVLVIQTQDFATLQEGMTVVFIGDQGFPVAHTLVAKTNQGWTATGVNNGYLDKTRVNARNYIGTAVRAFSPTKVHMVEGLVANAFKQSRQIAALDTPHATASVLQ